jgi:hypothetical protein
MPRSWRTGRRGASSGRRLVGYADPRRARSVPPPCILWAPAATRVCGGGGSVVGRARGSTARWPSRPATTSLGAPSPPGSLRRPVALPRGCRPRRSVPPVRAVLMRPTGGPAVAAGVGPAEKLPRPAPAYQNCHEAKHRREHAEQPGDDGRQRRDGRERRAVHLNELCNPLRDRRKRHCIGRDRRPERRDRDPHHHSSSASTGLTRSRFGVPAAVPGPCGHPWTPAPPLPALVGRHALG